MRQKSSLALAIILFLGATPVIAQVPVDYPIMAIGPPSSCELVTTVCDLPYAVAGLGTYDVWIAPLLEGEVVAFRLGVTWPDEWQLIEVEVCRGKIIGGGINGPGTGVTIELPPNELPSHRPALRLRLTATTPGRLALIPDPNTAFFGYRTPSGEWLPYYPGPIGDISRTFFVRIGPPPPCTTEVPPWQCNYCRAGGSLAGAITIPPRVVLPQPMVFADTVNAWSNSCGGLECDGSVERACLVSASTDVPWVTFKTIDGGDWGSLQLVMNIDARAQLPGTYEVCVQAGDPCIRNCLVVHYPLEIEVGTTALQPTTWGQIKANAER